jgi:hypothetical protein
MPKMQGEFAAKPRKSSGRSIIHPPRDLDGCETKGVAGIGICKKGATIQCLTVRLSEHTDEEGAQPRGDGKYAEDAESRGDIGATWCGWMMEGVADWENTRGCGAMKGRSAERLEVNDCHKHAAPGGMPDDLPVVFPKEVCHPSCWKPKRRCYETKNGRPARHVGVDGPQDS